MTRVERNSRAGLSPNRVRVQRTHGNNPYSLVPASEYGARSTDTPTRRNRRPSAHKGQGLWRYSATYFSPIECDNRWDG